MKSLFLFVLVISGSTKLYSQDSLILDLGSLNDTSKIHLIFGKDTLKVEDSIKLPDGVSEGFFTILAHGNACKIKIQNNAGQRAFIPIFNVNKDTSYKIVKDSFGNTKFDFSYNLSLQIFRNDSDQTLLKTYNNIRIILPNQRTNKGDTCDLPPSNAFVDSAMLTSINSSTICQSCLDSTTIKKRIYRQYSTDYFVTFDASHKFDDYTICKHIYRKNNGSDKKEKPLLEKYRKVAPSWFAPAVGSQLKFQVINMKLSEKFKIIVGDSDLFLNNASFETVVNNHLNATILASVAGNKLSGDSSVQKNRTTQQAREIFTCEADSDRINRLYGELSEYVREFNLSACTADANRHNMIAILSQIKSQFKLTGTDVLGELLNKFKNTKQESIASLVKDLISSLDSLKPLVYSTPRLVNRDYINIKVVNGNNETVADENIRTSFGLKIDYSAGVFLTGLRDDNFIFIDTTVRYSPDSATVARDTTGNFVRKQTSENLNVGFGVLVHVYPRISSNYNLGLTTGFMATTNLTINILLGGSFMLQSLFGSNNRVAFNGGIAWGKVKKLSSAYQDGYHTNPVVNPSNTNYTYIRPVFYSTTGDPTVQVWKRSWFFGITYNFK